MLYDSTTMPELTRRISFQFYKSDCILQPAGSFEFRKLHLPHPLVPGTQYEHSVCYTTVPPCQNWPKEFLSNCTNETAYYSLQALLSSGKSIYPIHSSRGTQDEDSVCYTTVPPCQN